MEQSSHFPLKVSQMCVQVDFMTGNNSSKIPWVSPAPLLQSRHHSPVSPCVSKNLVLIKHKWSFGNEWSCVVTQHFFIVFLLPWEYISNYLWVNYRRNVSVGSHKLNHLGNHYIIRILYPLFNKISWFVQKLQTWKVDGFKWVDFAYWC